MNFYATASTWMPTPTLQPVVTLTFNLKNLTRSLHQWWLMVIPRKFRRHCSSSSWDM